MDTVSPLHMNLQVENFQRCKRAFTCPITQVSSRVWCTLSLAPSTSGCVLCASSTSGCVLCASSTSGCAFVHFTVQYCLEYSSTVSLFQAQDVRKQA